MSSERSSSGVRNLRSIFETKSSDNATDTRGRSSSGLTSDKENSRPGSKVRASFVFVEPSGGMATAVESSGLPEGKRESAVGLRRGSFSESNEDAALDLKRMVSVEQERREKDSKVAEAIPEAAIESAAVTPMAKATEHDDAVEESPFAHEEDQPPANPDKSAPGAEEEASEMKPAKSSNENAVSGGEALPPATEDLRRPAPTESALEAESEANEPATAQETASKAAKKPASKKMAKGKPSSISTKTAPKASATSMKSPASQPKTPLLASVSTKTQSPRDPAKKTSRTSLTAPTAASVARSASSDRSAHSNIKQSPPSKTKPRDATKPIDLPSRLTAPTKAWKARRESESKPATSAVNGRSSLTSRPKPAPASARPTPRLSLARGQEPESQTSPTSSEPRAQADGSFLERMMRPTAASAQKTHEKVEVKSPPRTAAKTAAPSKAKVNGHAQKPGAELALKPEPPNRDSGGLAPEHEDPAPEPAHDKQMPNGGNLTQELVDDGKKPTEELAPGSALAPASTDGAEDEFGKKEEPAGHETPIPQTNGQTHPDAALEATPAALGGEETIR